MNAKKTSIEAWRPETEEDRDAIRVELENVLTSQHFCNSKRYPALLRFVVESALAGTADELKERTLGVEVFHRPADYDTNTDTVVRYTAGEVRKRLSLYYHDHATSSGVQISLPAGSYAPEFHRDWEAEEPAAGLTAPGQREQSVLRLKTVITPTFPSAGNPLRHVEATPGRHTGWWLMGVAAVLVLAAAAWQYSHRGATAVDAFWAPFLRERGKTLICTGGNVFSNNGFSGTLTAGRDTDYPFVSMQIASSISQLSGLLERGGATYEVGASASTPLNGMRDRPVILMGGYNNLWTLRLLTPLRYHFSPEPQEGIVDSEHPEIVWARDKAQSYANADDYALVVRFRDQTTGSMVIALAGLGRNGTEAATQFVTSPDYMRLLEQKLGRKLGDTNLEVVLKTNVIGGRTGAPSIQMVYLW